MAEAVRVMRIDLASGEVTDRRRTPQGGLVAKANLTRTGVFDYRMPDGSVRRELRHPDEVFHPDSLKSYGYAPVTVDHPGRVTPNNWKSVAVGHVADGVRQNGNFVAGEVQLQHGDAIDGAEAGKHSEISCGYECDIDPTPGVYQGKPYDVAQRKIRINHVAIGPKGWGRMGPDVKMQLDSESAAGVAISVFEVDAYVRGDAPQGNREDTSMTDEEKAALAKAEADAKAANEALVKARQDAADAKSDADKAKAKADADAAELKSLRAENDLLKLQTSRTVEDTKKADDEAKFVAAVEQTIKLREDARSVFSSHEDPDGKAWKADGKSNDQVRREVIAQLEPDYKVDGLEGDSLLRVYDLAMAHFARTRTSSARADVMRASGGPRQDGKAPPFGKGADDPDAEDERKKMEDRKRDAWKATPSRGDRRRDRNRDSKGGR